MTNRSTSTLLSALGVAIGLSLVVAAPAEAAQTAKSKKHSVAASTRTRHAAQSRCLGAGQVQCGPLYHGPEYLGDDPDPNIRFQILRDITGRYGGGGD